MVAEPLPARTGHGDKALALPIGERMHDDGNQPPEDGLGGAGTHTPLPWGHPSAATTAEAKL